MWRGRPKIIGFVRTKYVCVGCRKNDRLCLASSEYTSKQKVRLYCTRCAIFTDLYNKKTGLIRSDCIKALDEERAENELKRKKK